MEWDIRSSGEQSPSLCNEGHCGILEGWRRWHCLGLNCKGMLIRAVIYLAILSHLQAVYGGSTTPEVHWVDDSTDSLQHTGITEMWDATLSIDQSSLISDTQTAICHAQCTAKCCDSELLIPPVLTEDQENGTLTASPEVSCFSPCDMFTSDDWIEDCDNPRCVRNCGDTNPKSGTHLIPDPPYNLSLRQLTATIVYLEWMHDELKTRHSVLYVVETQAQEKWQSLNVTSNTFYNAVVDVCVKSNFKVASVNQFGYDGYSSTVTRSELPRPGPIEQLKLKEQPEYRNEFFHFVYKFRPPEGWNFHDVKVTPVFHDKECSSNPVPPVPIASIDESEEYPGTFEAEIKIHESGYSCNYFLSIVSYSKCDVLGEAFNFTVNITNCEVLKYECPEIPFRWPSTVENVSVEVEAHEMRARVSWLPLEDAGTSDSISSYLVQWGLIREYSGFQLPKLNEEGKKRVPGDQLHAVIYLNKTDTLYGVKVIGVVPVKENETEELVEQIDKIASMQTFTVISPSTAPPVGSGSTQPPGHLPHLPASSTPSPASSSSTTPFHLLVSSSLGMQPEDPSLTGTDLLPLYISVPLVAVVVGVLAAVLVVIHRRKVNNKEDLPRQVFTQSPGYDASMMKHVQNCMDSNPLYDLQYMSRFFDPYRTRTSSAVPEGDCWEMSHRYVTLGETLGRGAFGQVVRGTVKTGGIRHWRKISTSSTGSYADAETGNGEMSVAVKMLLDFAEDSHKQEFLKEMELMKKIGHHPNVVSMLGCVTQESPLCLIVEHVPHGDLLHYLRKHRQNIHEENSDSGITEDCPKLTIMDLLSMARQIATGMEFLAQKGFVHRDLACRNILVGENRVVKIGDFGLTRFIYDDKIYVTKKGGKLPLKWMAIESIFDLTFTSASDVWSFGVVLFELITLGGTPYPTIANKDLLRDLRAGHRMDMPDNCPDHLYEVMCHCWKEWPRDRPTFTNLRNLMDNMIESHCTADYMTFDIDTNRDYYTLESSTSSREGDGEDSCTITGPEWRTPHMDHTDIVEEVGSPPPKQDGQKAKAAAGSNAEPDQIVDAGQEEDRFRVPRAKQKVHKKSPTMAALSSPGLSMKLHSPLKVFRREGEDILSVSTCSTDQLLAVDSSAYSDSQTSLECNYETLTNKNSVKETKF